MVKLKEACSVGLISFLIGVTFTIESAKAETENNKTPKTYTNGMIGSSVINVSGSSLGYGNWNTIGSTII